jgi:hypothetical protein
LSKAKSPYPVEISAGVQQALDQIRHQHAQRTGP